MSPSPSLQHYPVLLQEAVAALNLRPGGIYVDGTFGRGGHSRAILSHLDANGCLIALDRDASAIAAGQAIQDSRFTLAHSPFSALSEVLRQDVLVAVPMHPICREDCAGLCSTCGQNLNEGSCNCAPEPDPRWASLAALLNQN